MTSLIRASVTLLFAAAFVAPRAAAAQEPRPGPEPKGLALEIVDGRRDDPLRVNVPERAPASYLAEFGPPRPLPGGARPEGRARLSGVRLRASYEGDAVRVKVAAVFDDSYPADAPGPKYGAREQELASLLAREGETVTVEEMRRHGFEPVVLKVVRAESEPKRPPTPAPTRAVSRLKSVEVISFSVAGAQFERGLLTLLNVSTKNISALEINVPAEGLSSTSQAAPGRALMQPGGSYQTEITLGSSGHLTPQGFVPGTPPEELVVGTVVFEDGSYEGDVKVAARMAARQKGRLLQFGRVLGLLRGAAGEPTKDAAATLDALRARVAGLRIDAESPLLEELLAQFPELARVGEGRKLMAESALDGLRAGREESLNLLRKVDAAAGADLWRQLESAREQIEKRGGARRD